MTNELMVTDEATNILMSLEHATTAFCSFEPKTEEEKKSFFNAINSPTARLKEAVNMEIDVKHVYAETVEFVNQETGETTPGVRMVFLTTDGKSYQAASKGIFSSTQKLFQIYGHPKTWKKPVKIRPKEISKGANRNVLIFELA